MSCGYLEALFYAHFSIHQVLLFKNVWDTFRKDEKRISFVHEIMARIRILGEGFPFDSVIGG